MVQQAQLILQIMLTLYLLITLILLIHLQINHMLITRLQVCLLVPQVPQAPQVYKVRKELQERMVPRAQQG
jgi:hypothetical protein